MKLKIIELHKTGRYDAKEIAESLGLKHRFVLDVIFVYKQTFESNIKYEIIVQAFLDGYTCNRISDETGLSLRYVQNQVAIYKKSLKENRYA